MGHPAFAKGGVLRDSVVDYFLASISIRTGGANLIP
jgi:hypothetical protein